MKKLIALVLALAMMVSVFALSASAATAPALTLDGVDTADAGTTYVLTVTLKGAASVAGIQGTVTADGATVSNVQINKGLLTANDTQAASTIAKSDDNKVSFVALVDTNVDSYATVRITYNVTENAPSFTLSNVVASDENAKSITSLSTQNKTTKATTDKATLLKIGMKPEKTAMKQGIRVHAATNIENAEEFGVIFYPTALLNGATLNYQTSDAIIAKVTKDNPKFDELKAEYAATLNFNFTEEADAAKFLGIKISAVAYCKDNDGNIYYSDNSVKDDKYIQGGIGNKAVLNSALDRIQELQEVITEDVQTAIDNLDGADYVENRNKVLAFVVDNTPQND